MTEVAAEQAAAEAAWEAEERALLRRAQVAHSRAADTATAHLAAAVQLRAEHEAAVAGVHAVHTTAAEEAAASFGAEHSVARASWVAERAAEVDELAGAHTAVLAERRSEHEEERGRAASELQSWVAGFMVCEEELQSELAVARASESDWRGQCAAAALQERGLQEQLAAQAAQLTELTLSSEELVEALEGRIDELQAGQVEQAERGLGRQQAAERAWAADTAEHQERQRAAATQAAGEATALRQQLVDAQTVHHRLGPPPTARCVASSESEMPIFF